MLLLVLLLGTLYPITYFLLSKYSKNQQLCPPPGPKGIPILGNLHQYSNTYTYFCHLSKTYGPIFMLKLMNKKVVVINSAKLAKEVIQTQDKNLCDRALSKGIKRLSYNGLDVAFGAYSELQREMKKLLVTHLFSSQKVRSFASVRREEVSRLVEAVASMASASKVVNLSELAAEYMSSTASRITFGKRYNDEEAFGRRYYRLLAEVQEMFVAFFYSDYVVGGGLLDKLTGGSTKLEMVFKELDAFYDKIIDDHLITGKLVSEQEEDVVHVLLRSMTHNSFPFKLTLNHIKATLMNLFTGGANASTASVIWVIVELLANPKSMETVQEELRNIAQNNGCVLESDLPMCKFFKAVVKETFRLHPPSPLLIPHKAVHKCVLQGYDIIPETVIILNAWSIGRDPASWKDPEKFMPERFLGNSIEQKGTGVMIPFGGGVRMCPGSLLGLLNVELALANLLYAFDWELPSGSSKEDKLDTSVLPGLVMHKKDQLCLVAKKF